MDSRRLSEDGTDAASTSTNKLKGTRSVNMRVVLELRQSGALFGARHSV